MLACRGVAGGNAVTCDFGPWRGLARADWEQFSPEERERIGDRLSEESTVSKNGVREINDEKAGKDFLEGEIGLLCIMMTAPMGRSCFTEAAAWKSGQTALPA